MCGIAGFAFHNPRHDPRLLTRMIAQLRHRGPDGFGFYRDERVGLAHARLSIIDLAGGWQPLHNEDKRYWVVFNGEIYNYRELRAELEVAGHVFHTQSDTEVLVHLYEERGEGMLESLNGQFAFALWDRAAGTLFLARDRLGVRPIYFALDGPALFFASEVKALWENPRLRRGLDPSGLADVFRYWTSLAPATVFRGIQELPEGCCLRYSGGEVRIRRYWDHRLEADPPGRSLASYAEEYEALLTDSIRLRLRADVPVGAYLSGGLDSTTLVALLRERFDGDLRTFSIGFEEAEFDEGAYQREAVDYLGVAHTRFGCRRGDVAEHFVRAVWHAEKPVLRTAPVPMMLLAGQVRAAGYRVVLTGEGADETLAGYDLFREDKVRRFLGRHPGSAWRPLLLKRLYPWMAAELARSPSYLQASLAVEEADFRHPCFSHLPRWKITSMIRTFFDEGLEDAPGVGAPSAAPWELPADYARWGALQRAQYVEYHTLLSGYLLSSQGDRMGLAHAVEGRYPFLDHRLVEFCDRLPAQMKLKVLDEKRLLKEIVRGRVPESIRRRKKQPYRSPDALSFFHGGAAECVGDLLGEDALKRSGFFDPGKVRLLLAKCARGQALGFRDNMALVGILSTQALHHWFCEAFPEPQPVTPDEVLVREGAFPFENEECM